ncbi:YcjF family protein [Gloeothece verrucosa]|uniref:EcsC family protein n=1 Tax=Gloeothece verrucosa (strain PCC 7822) TaxID=497965 RepID=E0UN25_GLOV7|nr:hypothetical protein [Gloeothece verrucosa]ADN18355.1 conserved hypothetical protein [Gloeothece verrucosa PCC 7822]
MSKDHSPSSSDPKIDRALNSSIGNSRHKAAFVTSFIHNAGAEVVKRTHSVGEKAASKTYQLIEQATSEAGRAMTAIGNLPLVKNPFVQKLAGVFKLDWLVGMSSSVDLIKASDEVKRLKAKYNHESSFEIAHRIILSKATQASGIGFVSSILPGSAAALLAVDFAATNALQTEMIYQIAAAYDQELQDQARQGEVLAIFGLALGGRNALKAGLGFMRNIPLAGAMIGASTNATMLYTLGYTACRFYEAKEKELTEEPTTETLKSLQKQSEDYLDVALGQQAIMDQILIYQIRASYPNKNWSDILPELEELKLEPESIKTIEANIQSPQPLDILLEQINPDFALALLAQCRQIALLKDNISPEEDKILQAIASTIDINDQNQIGKEKIADE